ncbi:MAG: hypothetical protein WCJ29_01645 [bacterium]
MFGKPKNQERSEALIAQDRFEKSKRLKWLRVFTLSSSLAVSLVGGKALAHEPSRYSFVETKLSKKELDEREEGIKKECDFVRDIFKRERINERVAALKEKYGENISPLLRVRGFNEAKWFVEDIEAGEKSGKKDLYINSEKANTDTLGQSLAAISEEWKAATEEQKSSMRKRDIPIRGLPDEPGISEKEIRSQLEYRTTSLWLKNSTTEIIYDREVKSMPAEYGTGGTVGGEVQTTSISEHRVPIRVFLQVKSMDEARREFSEFKEEPDVVEKFAAGARKASLIEVILHESAHTNDWMNSEILSNQERLEFLEDIGGLFETRYPDSSAFHSGYVDRIKNNDPKKELYIKVTEYWAELTAKYLASDREAFEKRRPAEGAVLRKWVSRME